MLEGTSGVHHWSQVTHARPTFCNVCREKLSGVPWHGFACDVCKTKVHRRCMERASDSCKWTVTASVPQHLQYISPENSILPHQWVEGNLSIGSKCAVCEKNCGSMLRLQDWRCLWCASCVHDGCMSQLGRGCSLGPNSLSVLSPLAVKEVSPNGTALLKPDAIGGDCGGGSPLLVLVNSKSGDKQGQRMIRKFKRLLNPLQVFDIISSGPDKALTFFDSLESFRVLVCGGDGTVGWVLSAFDRLNLHNKCQMAILPLGTGNDLARVLGWGHAFYDISQLPTLIRNFERAHTRMLDRWSVYAIEGPQADAVRTFEVVVMDKVKAVLEADQPRQVISTVRSLCMTVKELMEGVAATFTKVEEWEREAGIPTTDPVSLHCSVLLAKLESLVKTLGEDEQRDIQCQESGFDAEDEEGDGSEERLRRDSLIGRANSLKKALKDIISIAEKGIDQHNRESAAATKRERFKKKRSRTTPSGLQVSTSNLSSSSACSPPASPSTSQTRDRLQVQGCSQMSSTSGYGVSPSQSSNPGLSPAEESPDRCESDDTRTKLLNASIGAVQPPTPSGSREPSGNPDKSLQLFTADVANRRPLVDGPERSISQPDRPSCDDEPQERLFKLNSECQLYSASASPGDIKSSHSDSCIYGRTENAVERVIRPQWRRTKDRGRPAEEVGRSGMAGGSLIAEVLLLNARVLGMASHHGHTPLDQYKEVKVMNNYFGIGLDAKIVLDFHNKREEKDKTRSRSKLFLWYGMLGGREFMHRTYRNLDQRIRLECDGAPIELPSLQGIVILNIPSYSGGANFWGGQKDDSYTIQSFDDKVLEVVALFGVIHVATSRVPNAVRLQNHRIAQCRHVRIFITGDEPIPVQVDGEPWMQPPGILQIVHKNRAQLLVKNPVFDATLRAWEEQKERSTAPSTPTATQSMTEDVPFPRRAAEFVHLVESEIGRLGVSSRLLEDLETATTVVSTAERLMDAGTSSEETDAAREDALAAVEMVVEDLEAHFGWEVSTDIGHLLPRLGPAPQFDFKINDDDPDQWKYVVCSIRQEMSREEAALREGRAGQQHGRKRSRLAEWFSRHWRRRSGIPSSEVSSWNVDDVSLWLGSLSLGQYSTQFKANDIRGLELRHLQRDDLRDLGVAKIGHVKRIQSGIRELCEREIANRKESQRKRKGTSLSVERTGNEQPSVNSM